MTIKEHEASLWLDFHRRGRNEERSAGLPGMSDQPHLPDDETIWPSWSEDQISGIYAEKLVNGLQTSSFSSVEKENLPIDITQVVKSTRRDPEGMLYESIAFSIMGGNEVLLKGLLRYRPKLVASGLFPFHLAASYLDGPRSCDRIMSCLFLFLIGSNYRKLYINDIGHTVIDQLMITILKCHTSCSPGIVDEAFKRISALQAKKSTYATDGGQNLLVFVPC